MTDLDSIAARNARVEADKAWETCWMRKLFIAGITYLIVSLYLPILGVEKSYLHALVPVCGYLLSTLSLPLVKTWWLENQYKKESKH